jgi:gas vesicle protein
MSESSQVHSFTDQQGSFLNGFTLGLFAGAAGYFLFGTKKGNEFRTKINKEWQEAQKEILSSADISIDGTNTMTSVRQLISTIIDGVYTDDNKAASNDTKQSTKRTSKATKNPKKRLFRNIV